jgi:hypothetical protein
MLPLPAEQQAAMIYTTSIRDLDGGQVGPNEVTSAVLAGGSDADVPDDVARRMREAVAAAVASGLLGGSGEVASVAAFTTQSLVEEALQVAAIVEARQHPVIDHLGCEDRPNYRLCQITFEAQSFRGEDRAFAFGPDGGPVADYVVKANIYLPRGAEEFGPAPWPISIFGHGLNGDRGQAGRLADFAAPRGMATISIDAPEHGEHPARRSAGQAAFLDFFGISPQGFLPLALRDNWRQASFDKLALVDAIREGIDADGDGDVDLDAGRISYLGVSLGGIMGPELLALTPDIPAAVLVVGGGRVTDILQFSETFSPIVSLLRPSGYDENDILRFWPLVQTAIDRGDAAAWAPLVTARRLVGERPVQVLNAHVLDDDIVSNVSNFMLARALDIPVVPPLLRPYGVSPVAAAAPVAANLASGGTAATLQLDWVLEGDRWETATHNNVGDSTIGAHAWLRFLADWLNTGVATAVDPYVDLALTPPRDPAPTP